MGSISQEYTSERNLRQTIEEFELIFSRYSEVFGLAVFFQWTAHQLSDKVLFLPEAPGHCAQPLDTAFRFWDGNRLRQGSGGSADRSPAKE